MSALLNAWFHWQNVSEFGSCENFIILLGYPMNLYLHRKFFPISAKVSKQALDLGQDYGFAHVCFHCLLMLIKGAVNPRAF